MFHHGHVPDHAARLQGHGESEAFGGVPDEVQFTDIRVKCRHDALDTNSVTEYTPDMYECWLYIISTKKMGKTRREGQSRPL